LKKVYTFATRKKGRKEGIEKRETGLRKIKKISFGNKKKVFTFALPKRRKEKSGNAERESGEGQSDFGQLKKRKLTAVNE
jgi:hypothetical protein